MQSYLVPVLSIAILVAALTLWCMAKLLRFRSPSFWIALVCTLIMFGVWWVAAEAATRLVPASVFPEEIRFTGLLSLAIVAGTGFGFVVGVISVSRLFRESTMRAATAVGVVVAVEGLLVELPAWSLIAVFDAFRSLRGL